MTHNFRDNPRRGRDDISTGTESKDWFEVQYHILFDQPGCRSGLMVRSQRSRLSSHQPRATNGSARFLTDEANDGETGYATTGKEIWS